MDLDEKQNEKAAQKDGVDGQEIAGKDAFGLSAKELLLRRSRPSGHGVDALLLEDRAHRARCDRDTEQLELALDAPIAPGVVLLGEAHDEAGDLHPRGWPPDAPRVAPPARNQPAVPAQDRLGGGRRMKTISGAAGLGSWQPARRGRGARRQACSPVGAAR